MDSYVSSTLTYLVLVTTIASVSIIINGALIRLKLTAERAFWASWLFLIFSAETISGFTFFEYPFPVDVKTRELILVSLLSAAIGFTFGSLLASVARRPTIMMADDVRVARRTKRIQTPIAGAILLIGLGEFAINYSSYNNLYELRLAAVTGDAVTSPFVLHFFYFAQAFALLLGFSDAVTGRMSRREAIMVSCGLMLHNLAIGGRINIIIAPLLYVIPFLLRAEKTAEWRMGAKEEAFRNLSKASIGIIMLFPLLGIMRANEVDFEKVSSLDGFVKTVIFGLPRYLSDTLVSISVHADFAARSGVPTGYFTFDSFYRLFSSVLDVSLKDANEIFGHVYYRHLDAPYGWTQTNLIPRLIADFGDNFWLALMGIAALVQWISVCFFRVSFIGVCIRALMIIASAYSVLGAMWFSAFNMLILFYCVLLYWALSARVPTTAKQFM